MAAVGLLVWVLISKYLDHLPLYRLEQIAARDGVILARSRWRMGRPHRGGAATLGGSLIEHLLKRGTLHADETPVPNSIPSAGKPKKAYLCLPQQ